VRYYLVDRIDELKKNQYAVGTKCVTLTEDVFEHHFPGQPVFPGALLIESMAQLGGALLEISLRGTMDYLPRCVLTTVSAKFRNFAQPGDTLSMRAEVLSQHEESAKVRVQTTCGEKRICEAEILFVFLRIDDPRVEAQRTEYLDLLTRNTTFVD
jgi:3-hydroxymyristoyl/3-hydroxydecanoyl-(acyl carrier protein) dehydratase